MLRERTMCVVGCCNMVPLDHPVVGILQNNKPKQELLAKNKEQWRRSVIEPLRMDWGYGQTSQESVFFSNPLISPRHTIVKVFYSDWPKLLLWLFVTFASQLARFKRFAPKIRLWNDVDNSYHNSEGEFKAQHSNFSNSRIKHTHFNFTGLFEKRRNHQSLFIFVWLFQLLKQAVSANN